MNICNVYKITNPNLMVSVIGINQIINDETPNFITSEDLYLETADGLLFYVKESTNIEEDEL